MADSERIGPYRVIQRLGAGGMGEVVLAHDDRLDRLVAIKRLHADHAATPERRERFRREARIVARLNHPAIVAVYDVFQQRDHDYLIMEYVEGRTLRARRDAGPMAISEVLGLGHQIALGMAAAHDLGVIHRDLKAENVLITRTGRAKITDFGIAKLHGDDAITSEGVVVGTFHAMSPEQALGRAVDHRSDLFSFGILLYEAFAGESPFHADTPFLTVQRLVMDEPRPIAELVPAIPPVLASLIHQLLAKEPVLRPRDFREVAGVLIELAGQVCDTPCHGDGARGELARSPADSRPTEDPARSDAPSVIDTSADRPAAVAQARLRRSPHRVPWRSAAAAVAVVAALAIGYGVGGGSAPGASPRPPRTRVAVLAPQVSDAGDRPELALLAVAVRNAIVASLRARSSIELVPWADIESYADGVATSAGRTRRPSAIRTAVAADEIVATQLVCVAASCKVTIERDAEPPAGAPPVSFQLAADSLGRPGDTVSVQLSRLYPEHPVRDATAAGSIDPRDHERYTRLVHDYWARRAGPPTGELVAELARIRERSPQSIDVVLFEAEVLRHRHYQTEDPEYARRAIALLRDADRQFPDTYDILSARFDILVAADRLDEADLVLERLATLDPDSGATHLARAKLHHKRGRLTSARDELDAAARRDPSSWRVLYHRALVSRALGDRAATRVALAHLLELSPNNYAGLSLLGHEEIEAGRLACAEQIYAELVAREPLYAESVNLGYTYNQLGRYRDAAVAFHHALALRPHDPATRLNLAESLLLSGDGDAAGVELRGLHQLLARKRDQAPDGALRGRDLLVETQTLAYLGRDDPAMAAAARARVAQLVTPTARPSALHSAALVHAVLGDRELAARYTAAYLDGGGSPENLRYPWFAELRRDPVLGPRLAVSVATDCERPAPP